MKRGHIPPRHVVGRGSSRSRRCAHCEPASGMLGMQRRLAVESLESRTLLAVTAVLDGGKLLISYNAANDLQAEISSDGEKYTVSGTGLADTQFDVANVTGAIVVNDKAAVAGQGFRVSGAAALANPLQVDSSVERTILASAGIVTTTPGAVSIGSAEIDWSSLLSEGEFFQRISTAATNDDISFMGRVSANGLPRTPSIMIDAGSGNVMFGSYVVGHGNKVMRAGGTGHDAGNAVAALADGSLILTGSFQGRASFGSTTLESSGVDDIFVAKLDAAGNYVWATKAGGAGDDTGKSVATLPDGSLIVTGSFQGRASFGSTTLESSGRDDIFVAKLDAAGNYVWATKAGGAGDDTGKSVATLPDGSLIVTGSFQGRASFGSTTLESSGHDNFVATLDAAGTFVSKPDRERWEYFSALPDGSAIVAGFFRGTQTFGSTTLTSQGTELFVAKIDQSRNYVWATKASSVYPEYDGGSTSVTGIAALPDGSAFVTGEWAGRVEFFGAGELSSDIFFVGGDVGISYVPTAFLAKIDATGQGVWVKEGGAEEGLGGIFGYTQWRGVAALPDGSVIATGKSNRIADSDFLDSAFAPIGAEGEDDIFVARLDQSGEYLYLTGRLEVVARDTTFGGLVRAVPGNGRVALTWDTPSTKADSPILGYAVRYATVPVTGQQPEWKEWGFVANTESSATVTGLVNGTGYVFGVSARTAMGDSAVMTTAPSVPFSRATAPVITSAEVVSEQVRLTWNASESNGGFPVSEYAVQFAEPPTIGRGMVWKTATRVSAASSSVVISQGFRFTPGSSYLFRVVPYTKAGAGESQPTAAAIKFFIRASEARITSTVPGNASVTVAWNQPASDGGAAITAYAVQFAVVPAPGQQPVWKEWGRTAATARSAVVTGLVNGTGYLFRVSALNAAGYGAVEPTWAVAPGRATPPLITSTVPGNASVTVAWNQPATDGGFPISAYAIQYAASPAAGQQPVWKEWGRTAATARSAVVTGLVNGTGYLFRVSAFNATGYGAVEPTWPAVTPFTRASASTITSAVLRDGFVEVSWNAPASDGGSRITKYEVQYAVAPAIGEQPVWDSKFLQEWEWGFGRRTYSFRVGLSEYFSLTNGLRYLFRVVAYNAAGAGETQAPVTVVTPAGAAPAPSITSTLPGNASVTVAWNQPASDGGLPILAYAIQFQRPLDGRYEWKEWGRTAATARSAVVTGLVNGTGYLFRVSALNAAGYGAVEPTTLAVTPGRATPPSITSTVPGNARVTVAWNQPASDGGLAITAYAIQFAAAPAAGQQPVWREWGRTAATARSAVVTGLVNGTGYLFRVSAINATGYGTVQPTTSAVTPRA